MRRWLLTGGCADAAAPKTEVSGAKTRRPFCGVRKGWESVANLLSGGLGGKGGGRDWQEFNLEVSVSLERG